MMKFIRYPNGKCINCGDYNLKSIFFTLKYKCESCNCKCKDTILTRFIIALNVVVPFKILNVIDSFSLIIQILLGAIISLTICSRIKKFPID